MECWSPREKEREFKAHFNNSSAEMEGLQGPVTPCFYGEHSGMACPEQEFIIATERGEQHFSAPMLENTIPFLQMLQSVGSPQYFLPFKEPSFQTLLRLQHFKKPWEDYTRMPEMETQIQAIELESCVTHDITELQYSPVKSETMDLQNPHPASRLAVTGRERRKRKRTRPTKNKEEVESQRMTHIAVERNRRRQMNDHLNVLKSLMPASYIQRGDQASIIGGAIDFVKELEQLLHSLEAKKRMTKNQEAGDGSSSVSGAVSVSSTGFFISPQFTVGSEEGNYGEEVKAENKSEVADIEVTVIQTHVNLKIQCRRRPGLLLKAIVALEDLRLTVLHLNITSSDSSVLYSFNLKIEDECKLGSADEIASTVHQILSFINGS